MASDAANAVAPLDYPGAIKELEKLLARIDGIDPLPDWMVESPVKWDLADEVRLYISLLELT